MTADRGPVLAGAVRDLPGPSLAHLLERVVRRRRDHLAVRGARESLSFAQLWERASAHAAELRAAGVGSGDFVALWADRTEEVVAAAIAVLMLGAAYVPLDPQYPEARVRSILTAAAPKVLLVDEFADSAPPPDQVTPVLTLGTAKTGRAPRPPELRAGPDDAAYVLFTSGSTGLPKGVVVEHRSLVNYCAWWSAVSGEDEAGTPVFGSLGFDHTVTTFWPTLLRGAPITLCGGLWDAERLLRPPGAPYSAIKFTPSQLRFLERTGKPDYRAACRTLVLGGEALEPALIRGLAERLRGVRLVNHYGPTETTVGTCWHEFSAENSGDGPVVPIGRPIWNARLYVVGPGFAPVEPGEPGELVVAGTPVARGYLGGGGGFVEESEFGGRRGRAYRTGDQVRLAPSGLLEYLGRLDRQVKVNGHRVELDELRHHALLAANVVDAAFAVSGEGMQHLEAFVVCAPGADHGRTAAEVRALLGRRVPAAMVPKEVTIVPELGMTVHGKLDLTAARAAARAGDRTPR